MTNSEQSVLAAIAELEAGEPREKLYDRCHMCSREWHGLPRDGCIGYAAREDAVEAWLGHVQEPARATLRAAADVGWYMGPRDFLGAFLAGDQPAPLLEDTSLWDVIHLPAPGVEPRCPRRG